MYFVDFVQGSIDKTFVDTTAFFVIAVAVRVADKSVVAVVAAVVVAVAVVVAGVWTVPIAGAAESNKDNS